jgi:hypothetical protein
VCTQENGAAGGNALKAQAIAARTYLLRAMRDDASLGTTKPIGNGEFFQAYAKVANQGCLDATEATRGVVARYKGELTIANYVAGSLVKADGTKGTDPTSTEKWVTYNEGKSGAEVTPTKLSYTSRTDNRGCMSQNRAAYLSNNGYDHGQILRYFYGADLELNDPTVSEPAAGGCGAVDYRGSCDGDTLVWCEENVLKTVACGDSGKVCAYQDDTIGNNCVAAPAPPASGCGEVTFEGYCDGATLVWCEAEKIETFDCAGSGKTCGWQADANYNNCL